MHSYTKRKCNVQNDCGRALFPVAFFALFVLAGAMSAWANGGCKNGVAPNIHRGGGLCSCSGKYWVEEEGFPGYWVCPNIQCSSGSGTTNGISWNWTADKVVAVGGCLPPINRFVACQQANYPYTLSTYDTSDCQFNSTTGQMNGLGCVTTGSTPHTGLVGWNPPDEPCLADAPPG